MKNLWRKLENEVESYEFKIGRKPEINSFAHLLGNVLYQKKNFPFYTFNLLAGFESNGEACVYNYDAIGSYEKKKFSFVGSAGSFAMPILDSQFQQYNDIKKSFMTTQSEIENFVVTIFNSIAERDLYCGDGIELIVLHKDGRVENKHHNLRRD